MSVEAFVKLVEELVDIKVQQQLVKFVNLKPGLARLLEEKRQSDNRRIEMIRRELVDVLSGQND